MDFAKLSSNEKLAVYGAVAAIIGAFLSFGGGGSFGILTGLAMLVIIFLPQFSPSTRLPGSKGSLMLVVGGLAALGALLALLAWLPYLGLFGGVFIGLLIGIAGQLLMGWAAWREFQSEGGKFNLGMASSASAPSPPAQSAPPPMTPPPPPAEPMQPPPPMAPPMGEPMEPRMSEPMGESPEGSAETGGDKPSEGSMGGG
ncbi:MAG: hypothetical protein E6J47_04295 [Chloroflexi bacterium]|nr:MAG: hypothetical protein E6J47_04295 [Chloroflexota bacterium]